MGTDWGIPEKITIHLEPDEDGFTGRECPQHGCEGYFKVQFGTGLKGENLSCHCPYCGHIASHDHFATREQIEYAQSVGMRQLGDIVRRELKKLEFNYPPQGPFGIGISMKLQDGAPLPIRYYREKQLETDVVCQQCTLRYAIYGVFAYCPDCGLHNSPQILSKNLELTLKELALASQVDSPALADHLIADALENAVSAFDGFGRETLRVNAHRSTDPKQAEKLSFQSLAAVRIQIKTLFGIDLASGVKSADWELAIRCFNKRHLLAHKMGVIDQRYIDATNDPTAVVGRRIAITPGEVRELVGAVQCLGDYLIREVQ